MKRSLFAAVLYAAGSALASTNDFLTWEQCLDRTKAQSPELVSARAAVRELEYGVASASSGFLPDISASASTSRGQGENRNNWSDRESVGTDLSLSQDLFAGGGNVAKRKRALAQLQIGGEQYRQTLSAVEMRARIAYVDVLYAQDLIALTEKIEERRANNVRLIQLRFDGGRENAGSLARSKAQLSDAAYEVRQAKRALTYALRNLAAAMGQMEPVPGASGDLQAETPGELDNLLELMKQTPDYSIATTQIESSKEGMKITRSARFPKVSLGASVGISSSDHSYYEGSWSASLRASVPIYSGNQLKSDEAAAMEKIVQSEMDLIDTANSLMATLQQRWNAYVDAVESETTQKELYDAELLRAEISTAKYKQGLLSYEDWDVIESNVISQGKTYLQRRRASENAQAQWKNALGWSVWQETAEGE